MMLKILLPPWPESETETETGPFVELYLFRHGYTRYNQEKRYLGRTDLPLLEEEYRRLTPRHDLISSEGSGEEDGRNLSEVVYVSPALRAGQTASLLFPGIRQVPVPEFMEMDFGIFEGRSAKEMEEDREYRGWVDSMCEDPVPGGESRAQFTDRVTGRFGELAAQALQEKRKRLLIVAHGGTQMAVMERFGPQEKPYWAWQTAPGGVVTGRICNTVFQES